MRVPDASDIRFLARTVIVALAVYICAVLLLNDEFRTVSAELCMYDNKYYTHGAIVDMAGVMKECAPDPNGSDAQSLWTFAR